MREREREEVPRGDVRAGEISPVSSDTAAQWRPTPDAPRPGSKSGSMKMHDTYAIGNQTSLQPGSVAQECDLDIQPIRIPRHNECHVPGILLPPAEQSPYKGVCRIVLCIRTSVRCGISNANEKVQSPYHTLLGLGRRKKS